MRSTNYKFNNFVILNFSSHFFLNPKCCTEHHFLHHSSLLGEGSSSISLRNNRYNCELSSLNFWASSRVQIIRNIKYLTTGLHLGPLPSTACFSTRKRLLRVHTSSECLRLILSQNFFYINTPTFSFRLFLLTPPMKMEQTVFRNVGIYNSDAAESPKRKNTTFRTRRKFEIKNVPFIF
jgi:hypothetical protein